LLVVGDVADVEGRDLDGRPAPGPEGQPLRPLLDGAGGDLDGLLLAGPVHVGDGRRPAGRGANHSGTETQRKQQKGNGPPRRPGEGPLHTSSPSLLLSSLCLCASVV